MLRQKHLPNKEGRGKPACLIRPILRVSPTVSLNRHHSTPVNAGRSDLKRARSDAQQPTHSTGDDDQAPEEEENEPLSDENDESQQKLPPLVQCASYAANMLGRSPTASHAMNLVCFGECPC